jgi:hypothetical protein
MNFSIDDCIGSLDIAICKLLVVGDLLGEAKGICLTEDHAIGLATMIKEIHREVSGAKEGIAKNYKSLKAEERNSKNCS